MKRWIVLLHLFSSHHCKVILATTVLPIFISGCGGIASRAPKLIDDVPIPSPNKLAKLTDDVPIPSPNKLAPAIEDVPFRANHNIPSAEPAESIANLIRTAGGPAGRSYVRNQLATGSPISRKSLALVIYEESLNELTKTGKSMTARQLIDLQHTSSFLGNEIIQETTSNNPEAQVTEE